MAQTNNDIYTVQWKYDSQIADSKEKYEIDYTFDYIAEYNSTANADFPGLGDKGACDNSCLQLATSVDKKSVQSHNATSNGDTLNSYVFTGNLVGVTGASVEITIFVSTAPVEFDNRSTSYISPNVVKIDVRVHDWPYTNKADTMPRLAFGLNVKSKAKVKEEGGSTQTSQLNLGDGGETGAIFGWANEVTKCGDAEAVPSPVVVSRLPDKGKESLGNGYTLIFSVHDDSKLDCMLWDPTTGTSYNDDFCIGSICGGGAYALVIFIIVLVCAVIGGIAYFVVKKRNANSADNYSNFE